MRLVQDYLLDSAQRSPGKTALVCDGVRYSYGDLSRSTVRMAAALVALGVQRHDRVVLWLPNSAELVIAIFAVLQADATFVVINESVKPDKLCRILVDCAATALVAPRQHWPAVQAMQARLPDLRVVILVPALPEASDGTPGALAGFEALLAQDPSHGPARRSIDRDLACLVYTSGSTGEPKGIMCAHHNVDFAAASIISYLGNVADDVIICALPLSFDYGLYQLLMAFRFGGTLVLERSFAYPGRFLDLLVNERVTGLPGVPTMFGVLLRMDLEALDLRSLRYLTNTGAALPAAAIEGLRTRLPQAKLFSMYGLSETKRTLYLPPEHLHVRPESVGIAIPGTEVWLVDDNGAKLRPGAVGELVIRGGHVMRGYWGDPELSKLRFRPGPLPGETICYSGDLFRMDSEGFLYFVGRKDEVFKSRGEKVSPHEVEAVLHRLPGVLEAAVVGVKDPILGHAIKAYVCTGNPPLTERDVIRHCRKHLEDFLVPKHVEFVESLPKSPSGKILKGTLRERQ